MNRTLCACLTVLYACHGGEGVGGACKKDGDCEEGLTCKVEAASQISLE